MGKTKIPAEWTEQDKEKFNEILNLLESDNSKKISQTESSPAGSAIICEVNATPGKSSEKSSESTSSSPIGSSLYPKLITQNQRVIATMNLLN